MTAPPRFAHLPQSPSPNTAGRRAAVAAGPADCQFTVPPFVAD